MFAARTEPGTEFWWAELLVRDTAGAAPAPQAPGTGSSISAFISYFQVPGCPTGTETQGDDVGRAPSPKFSP